MSSDRDSRLGALFQAAHADVRTPSFDRILSRRHHRRRLPARLLAAAAVTLVAVLAVPLARHQRERRAFEFAKEVAAWKAPSDVLLELPESQSLLSDVGGESILDAAEQMVRWRN